MRIASHLRLYGRIGQYCTNPDHMPDNHKKYLECACERALYYSPQPSYRSIKTILTTGSDQISIVEEPNKTTSEHGFTRDSDYYRGK